MTEDRFCTKLAAEDLNASDPEEMCDATMKFYSMQYSLIINILIVFLGAIGFFITAVFIVKDKERVERYVAGKPKTGLLLGLLFCSILVLVIAVQCPSYRAKS